MAESNSKNEGRNVVDTSLQLPQQQQSDHAREISHTNDGMDSFLATMTFAHQGEMQQQQQLDEDSLSLFCDCGDCEQLPALFRQAIRNHKRMKRDLDVSATAMALKRTQERRLMQRCENGKSVWEWTLPLNAEPLVEFGNSHRFVLVRSLSEHACIQTLGNGIIGSYDEETTRKDTHWKEGHAYFIPSNGGKAVGWFHASVASNSVSTTTPSLGHAILIMFKIPTNQLIAPENADNDCTEGSVVSWAETIRRLCCQTLDCYQQQQLNDAAGFAELASNDVKVLCDAIFPETM